MNQFRKCESTTSGECGSTGRPGTIRPGLGSGLQIGAPAGARQHLESLRLLLAIGQRRDRIIIEPVLPIALDIADTYLACPAADLPPQAAGGDMALQLRRGGSLHTGDPRSEEHTSELQSRQYP